MTGDVAYPLSPLLELMRELWALDHTLALASKRMLARTGLTMQQRVVLGIVRRYPSITPGRLARLLHLDAGTVSATIRRLEANRWVERRIHARDRRQVAIGLTDAGHAIDVATVSPVERAIERALGRLDAADLAAFRRVVEAVIEELAHPEDASRAE